MSIIEIQSAVSELSEQERGRLAVWFLDSLPPHSGEDGAVEGLAEAARRREELNSGLAQPLSADEFWDSINQEQAMWK